MSRFFATGDTDTESSSSNESSEEEVTQTRAAPVRLVFGAILINNITQYCTSVCIVLNKAKMEYFKLSDTFVGKHSLCLVMTRKKRSVLCVHKKIRGITTNIASVKF